MCEIEEQVRGYVIEAIKAQIENPTRACVNSEACFVAQRLRDSGYTGVAARYWNWVCMGRRVSEFGQEVYDLQKKLDEIDKEFVMPSWGTYGT